METNHTTDQEDVGGASRDASCSSVLPRSDEACQDVPCSPRCSVSTETPQTAATSAVTVSAHASPSRSRAFGSIVVRLCSGFVYVLLYILAVILGPIPLAFLMSCTAGICCWEFFRLMRSEARSPNQIMGIGFAILMPFVALTGLGYMVGLIILMVMLLGIWYVSNLRVRITDVAITVFGVIYTGLSLSALVVIREGAGVEGVNYLLLCLGVLASIWGNDTCAYLVGSQFGRHKMVPRISPKKSWEGLFGGILGSILVWLILSFIPGTGIDWPVALVAGLICGISGVVGDLFESRIKRGAGVKDSGKLIPGHGGLLDRTDSTFFVAIAAYYVLRFVGLV